MIPILYGDGLFNGVEAEELAEADGGMFFDIVSDSTPVDCEHKGIDIPDELILCVLCDLMLGCMRMCERLF
jgi:hypothetical protein